MKRVYFEDVLSVIKESIESVDENVYKDLIDECVRTLKNGGKIIASGSEMCIRDRKKCADL